MEYPLGWLWSRMDGYCLINGLSRCDGWRQISPNINVIFVFIALVESNQGMINVMGWF